MGTWQFFAFASAFFAALTAILGKIGVRDLNSDAATWIRTVVILAVISLLLFARGEWRFVREVNTHSLTFLVLSGIATGASWLCYYRALQLGPASRVAPIDKLSVVLAILLALVFLGERLSLKAGVGAAFIALGSLLVALG